jgi:hypothetical protein
VDGDGNLEIIAGAPGVSSPQYQEGAVFQYSPLPAARVARIDPFYLQQTGGYLIGATVTIRNHFGAPLRSAQVDVLIQYPDGSRVRRAATTDANGRARVTAPTVQPGAHTFTVHDIRKAGMIYDRDLNTETSDTIVIPGAPIH